jgi:hypothetical protein
LSWRKVYVVAHSPNLSTQPSVSFVGWLEGNRKPS